MPTVPITKCLSRVRGWASGRMAGIDPFQTLNLHGGNGFFRPNAVIKRYARFGAELPEHRPGRHAGELLRCWGAASAPDLAMKGRTPYRATTMFVGFRQSREF
jgi:hypothetical protein